MVEQQVNGPNGRLFAIIRDGEQVGEARGFKNTTDGVIWFLPEAGVRTGDWLANEHGDRLYVSESDPIADFDGPPVGIKAFYETGRDYERQESAAQVIATLEDIADAIWTLSDKKMPPEEKEASASLGERTTGDRQEPSTRCCRRAHERDRVAVLRRWRLKTVGYRGSEGR